MEKEVLECVLKKRCDEDAICKILSVESSPAVEKFRNFLSTVCRLRLRVVLGSGRQANRSLILKKSHVDDPLGQQFIDQVSPFKTEIMMFQTVLKEMEHLMTEFEDTDEILWCRMIYSVPNTTVVLEDLQPRGFTLVDRSYCFDLDHTLMTVNALGKYHALTKVLEGRGILSKDSFKPWFAFNNPQMLQFSYQSFQNTIKGIKLHWDSRWSSLVDRVHFTKDDLQRKLKELSEVELSFNVVCHGDCNKNNFLFKYDWNKRPIGIKLIDFQLSFYGSPCCDLNHIMYCCAHPTVRRNNFLLIIKTYHESLCRTLDSYKYAGVKPSLEELIEGMETYSFQGYFMFVGMFPVLFMGDEIDKYVDMKKIMATGGQEGYNLDYYKLEPLIENYAPDVEDFINKFF